MRITIGVATDQELAKYLGIAKTSVSSWRARKAIPYEHIDRISQTTDTSFDWLLTGEGPMRKEATTVPADTLLDDSFESEVLAGVWRAMSTDERRELIKNLLSRREPA